MSDDKIALIHEIHDHEQLRSRMRRLLTEHQQLLATASAALQRGKTEVTSERLDHVLDSIQHALGAL